jgi:hypothetical protein
MPRAWAGGRTALSLIANSGPNAADGEAIASTSNRNRTSQMIDRDTGTQRYQISWIWRAGDGMHGVDWLYFSLASASTFLS